MQKTVTVAFQGENNPLTFDPPTPIELAEGDWVEWKFLDPPSDSLPIIEFESPFGPFQCLQSLPNGTVQGKGNVGEDEEKTYNYKAFLLKQTNGSATFGTNSVRNLPQPRNTSPVLQVRVTEGEELTLHVPPESLMLFPGDTAFWNVFGLPEGTFISFLFHPAPAHPNLDPLVGPFQSLVARRRVGGEEADVMRVTGVNFMPTSMHYTYQIAIRDSAGQILDSHDPTIDNLGDPPAGAAHKKSVK